MAKTKETLLNGRAAELESFLKAQLNEARERFGAVEAEAEKALRQLVTQGASSRKELDKLITRARNETQALGKRAEKASQGLRTTLDVIQNRVVAAVGVASQAQVREISRELNRISKKVDALAGKKAPKTSARA